jgi:hypothetical protein
MKKLLIPTTNRIDFNKNVHRMDPMQTLESVSTTDYMNQLEAFPKDFFPMMSKKYSVPSHIYKHVYVTSPTKDVVKHKPKKRKPSRKEDSWMDSLNPFGCESENEDYEEGED